MDDAIDWLDGRTVEDDWLLWVGFVAPHAPLHAPPQDLHDYELTGAPEDSSQDHFEATVQAMDTEIGRLFDELEQRGMDDVTVLFLGDNGTGEESVPDGGDPNRAKHTLYEGGIHVPMCISGPQVAEPGTSGELVHSVDVYATVSDLFEIDEPSTPAIDSVSMAPILRGESGGRTWLYSEGFMSPRLTGNGQAMRDERYKIIHFETLDPQAFDLLEDPAEDVNLLNEPELDEQAAAAIELLNEELATLRSSE
ncbi:MAG: sulfatase-like hydrolase/transferase [Proteobacteria bacterium]|nr:sulfatase-like hydrolase/transferase [Pseudomonadota bacterium]MCP4916388.1 sulfatase-like hydrolase/transferase [Pseudomonadota bacterium]